MMDERNESTVEAQVEAELERQYRRIERGIWALRTEYEVEIARLKAENARLQSEIDGLMRWRIVRGIVGWRRMRASLGKLSPARMRQLRRTAIMTLRREGAWAVIRRGVLWLSGRRGYWRELAGVTPPPKAPPRRVSSKYPLYGFADGAYADHAARTEPDSAALDRQVETARTWADRPLITLVTRFTSANPESAVALKRSLQTQTYDRWEWQISGIDAAALAADEPRIRSLDQPHGEWIGWLPESTQLSPSALYRAVEAARSDGHIDALYADMDALDSEDRRTHPWFKPDWSPEMLLSVNLFAGFALLRRSHWLNADESAWAAALRLAEQGAAVYHLPYVLAHRRANESTAPTPDDAAAIAAYLTRIGAVEARAEINDGMLRAAWKATVPRKVSIIIPTKDNAPILERCLTTLFNLTDYAPFEVVLVDTGSADPAAWALYERFPVRIVRYTEPFNFSRACNIGAAACDGDLLLFLNNDTEILHADWLARMTAWFAIKGIGAVGAKLLYPDGTIQHAGVIVGGGGVAGHVFIGVAEGVESIYGSDRWTRNLLAVTGACLMIERALFEDVGGFDERYKLNYSDIALCLRVHEAGRRVVYDPHIRLIHHEAQTHGRNSFRSDIERAGMDYGYWFERGDPFYNPNLTYMEALPTFRRTGETGMGNFRAYLARLPQREGLRLPDDFLW
jgi:GT2 family glycosyltransferase